MKSGQMSKRQRERGSQEGQKMNEDDNLMPSEEGVKAIINLKMIILLQQGFHLFYIS